MINFAVVAVWGIGCNRPSSVYARCCDLLRGDCGLGVERQHFPCLCFFPRLRFHIPYTMLQNVFNDCAWSQSLNLYNFQQRISWLSHRWRTQRNAISNVNCRIQWIIESLNAPCALWYSEGHACLSVIKLSTLFAFTSLSEAWMWGLAGFLQWMVCSL